MANMEGAPGNSGKEWKDAADKLVRQMAEKPPESLHLLKKDKLIAKLVEAGGRANSKMTKAQLGAELQKFSPTRVGGLPQFLQEQAVLQPTEQPTSQAPSPDHPETVEDSAEEYFAAHPNSPAAKPAEGIAATTRPRSVEEDQDAYEEHLARRPAAAADSTSALGENKVEQESLPNLSMSGRYTMDAKGTLHAAQEDTGGNGGHPPPPPQPNAGNLERTPQELLAEARKKFAEASAEREKYRRSHQSGKLRKAFEFLGLKKRGKFKVADEESRRLQNEYENTEHKYRQLELQITRDRFLSTATVDEVKRREQRMSWINAILDERTEFNKTYVQQLAPEKESPILKGLQYFGTSYAKLPLWAKVTLTTAIVTGTLATLAPGTLVAAGGAAAYAAARAGRMALGVGVGGWIGRRTGTYLTGVIEDVRREKTFELARQINRAALEEASREARRIGEEHDRNVRRAGVAKMLAVGVVGGGFAASAWLYNPTDALANKKSASGILAPSSVDNKDSYNTPQRTRSTLTTPSSVDNKGSYEFPRTRFQDTVVTAADRQKGLWGIFDRQLSDPLTIPTKNAWFSNLPLKEKIGTLEQFLKEHPAKIKAMGFKSGDINIIRPGDRLSLSRLNGDPDFEKFLDKQKTSGRTAGVRGFIANHTSRRGSSAAEVQQTYNLNMQELQRIRGGQTPQTNRPIPQPPQTMQGPTQPPTGYRLNPQDILTAEEKKRLSE